MAHCRFRTRLIRGAAVLVAAGVTGGVALAETPSAHADAVAYLVNVTVRPGYGFPNADAALAYGHGICGEIAAGRRYGEVMNDVKSHFNSADEYLAAYLINQAANELCPEQISQLRSSAAGYRPSTR